MPNDLNMLRTSKIGQKGYLQEDVLNIMDEYETKIEDLQKELQKVKNASANADIDQLNNIIKTLEDRLKANDKALNTERQNYRSQLDSYEEKLRRATANGGFSPAMEKELNEKDETIAKKDAEIAMMQDKVQEVKNFLLQKDEDTNKRISEKETEIATLNETIQRLTEEKETLQASIISNANNDTSQSEIANLKATVQELNSTIDGLNSEVESLNAELETKVDITDYDELSKKVNINRLGSKKIEILLNNAEEQANDTILEANAKAEDIVSEAQKVKSDAQEEADKILNEANEKSETVIKEAEKQAENIIKEAEMSAHDKLVEINEKSDSIAKTSNDFKSIVMEQIGFISDGISSIMGLIDDANNKFASVADKVSNDETLTELTSNLPKEDIPEIPIQEEPAEPEDVVDVEIEGGVVETSKVEEAQEVPNEDPIETPMQEEVLTREEVQPPFEEYVPPIKSEFKIDGLDDLLKAVEESTPEPENEEVQPPFEEYVPPIKSEFKIDGLDDLLKAVEESTPDEEEEVPEESTNYGGSVNAGDLNDLLKEVENYTNHIEDDTKKKPAKAPKEAKKPKQESFDDMDEIALPILEDMG